MDSGEHDYRPADQVKKYLLEALDRNQMSYGPLTGLEEAISCTTKLQSHQHDYLLSPECFTFCPSATVALALCSGALLAPNDHAIFLGSPIYYALINPVLSLGADTTIVPFTKSGDVDIGNLEGSIRTNTKIIFITNPHSPTGETYSLEDLRKVASICEKNNIVVISDEVYEHFVMEGQHTPLYKSHDYFLKNGIVISSLSKCFNVTGAGAAFLVANPHLIKAIENYYGGPIFMTSIIAQLITQGCAEFSEWIPEFVNKLKISRDKIVRGLSNLPRINFISPDAGMFIWITIDYKNSKPVCEALAEQAKIKVYPSTYFAGGEPNQVRVNFATHPEVIEVFLERFGIWLTSRT